MFQLTDIRLADLVDKYSTPMYVMDKRTLTKSLESFQKAFTAVHPKFTIAYPFKTNNLRDVIQHYNQLGLWAEVTSGIELSMAANLQIPNNKIVFNGPWKTNEELQYACSHNILTFIDNEPECERLELITNNMGLLNHSVGIRVNAMKTVGGWNKFGFDIEDGTALSIAKRIGQIPSMKLVGIHAHFRSNINDIGLYKRLMELLNKFQNQLTDLGLLDLKYLDIGSGFAIPNPKPIGIDWKVPSLNKYAKVVKDSFHNLPEDVTLLVEPGRILVSDAVVLLTKVIAVKASEKNYNIIVDCGVNMLPGRDHYEYPVRLLSDNGNPRIICNINGALCSNYDIIADNVKLPAPKVGDVLVISNVGAYDLVRSFSWNLPLPPVVMIEEGETNKIIRRKETLDDIWQM